MARTKIGIELDTQEIRFAIKKHNGYRFFASALPINLSKDGKIIMPATMTEFLRNLKKSFKLPHGEYTLVLSGNIAFCRRISMPYMTEKQLLLNLPYEFKDYVQDSAAECYYDYAVDSFENDEEGNPVKMNILAALSRKRDIDSIADVFKTAHIAIDTAVPLEMVCTQIFRNAKAKSSEIPSERCVIELGSDSTRMLVFTDDKLESSRLIPIGCTHICAAAADSLNIDINIASTYIRSNYDNVLDLQVVRDICSEISIEVLKGINFIRFNNRETTLNDIFFCGYGTELATLTEAITEQTGLTPHNLIDLIPSETPIECEFNRFAISCGAVLNEVSDE